MMKNKGVIRERYQIERRMRTTMISIRPFSDNDSQNLLEIEDCTPRTMKTVLWT